MQSVLSALVFGIAILCSGCGKKGAMDVTGSFGCEASIQIAPASVELHVGGIAQLSATLGCDNTPVVVRWRAVDTTVVAVDSVSGVVRGVATGTATVNARAVADANAVAAVVVDVTP